MADAQKRKLVKLTLLLPLEVYEGLQQIAEETETPLGEFVGQTLATTVNTANDLRTSRIAARKSDVN